MGNSNIKRRVWGDHDWLHIQAQSVCYEENNSEKAIEWRILQKRWNCRRVPQKVIWSHKGVLHNQGLWSFWNWPTTSATNGFRYHHVWWLHWLLHGKMLRYWEEVGEGENKDEKKRILKGFMKQMKMRVRGLFLLSYEISWTYFVLGGVCLMFTITLYKMHLLIEYSKSSFICWLSDEV